VEIIMDEGHVDHAADGDSREDLDAERGSAAGIGLDDECVALDPCQVHGVRANAMLTED
jgi:hypothetical protein